MTTDKVVPHLVVTILVATGAKDNRVDIAASVGQMAAHVH